jgi:serine/threonine protein kinase
MVLDLLLCCSVPNITAYHGAFQTRDEICIVMEYCPRGDLLERLLAEGRAFDEPRVAEVSATLLSTLQVPVNVPLGLVL